MPPECTDPQCPNKRRVNDLEKELRLIRRMLLERHEDLMRCPMHPRGERCGFEIGHDGPCKWGSGD